MFFACTGRIIEGENVGTIVQRSFFGPWNFDFARDNVFQAAVEIGAHGVEWVDPDHYFPGQNTARDNYSGISFWI